MPKIGSGVLMFALDTNANVCPTTYIAISAPSTRWRYFFRREARSVPRLRRKPGQKPPGAGDIAALDCSEEAVKARRNQAGRRKTTPEKDLKHAAYAALLEGGMSKSKAAQALGYSISTVSMLDKAIERKGLTISIVTDKRLRASHKVVDRLLAGKVFGSITEIKDSTALRAAEIVLDRAEPKRPEGNTGNTTLSFTSINLARYQQDPPIPIDGPLSGASIIGQAVDVGHARAMIQGVDGAHGPSVGGLKAHRDSREEEGCVGSQFQEDGE